jgi:hypothetical protein
VTYADDLVILCRKGKAVSNTQTSPLKCATASVMLSERTLLLSAAHHVSRGAVKICLPAGIKAKTSPFGGALDFRAAENVDDPLRAAAVLSIAMGLDEAA